MTRNQYGFPIADADERLAQAQTTAAEIRERNFPLPCNCAECVTVRNLPAVQRIIAKAKLK